jgi:hypothetical protein
MQAEGIPLDERADLLAHYRAQRSDLIAAIDGLSDDQLCERTLDGWSVKDHLAHIALWDDLRAAEVVRLSAGFESAWRMDGRDDEYSGLAYDMRTDFSVAQARWELTASHERLLAAILEATPAGLDPARYGEAGLRSTHEAEHSGWIRRWRDERGY